MRRSRGRTRKRQVLDAHAGVKTLAPSDLLHGQTSRAWTASARAHLDALQLESIAALADRQVTGTVTGDLKVDGLHKDGHASFALDIETAQGRARSRTRRAS